MFIIHLQQLARVVDRMAEKLKTGRVSPALLLMPEHVALKEHKVIHEHIAGKRLEIKVTP